MSDRDALERLGYAQELLRRMGGFSSFAVSFSIISVLTGCITGYTDAIATGGPRALGIGWPLVSAGTLLVALAMAELASAFPTAGALYHWSALLGGPGYGWLTAAVNITGQVAIVAAVDVGCASELAATLGVSPRWTLPLVFAILLTHGLVNALSVRLVARLNDLSATVHLLGVLTLVALLLGRSVQPVSFLAVPFTTRVDGNVTAGMFGGLVLSMFTFTGYDASAHMAEETHDPSRRAPWGIVSSVVVSAVAGYLLLAALTLGIDDLPTTARSGHAALSILRLRLGGWAGEGAMTLALLAMWFCGLSSMTSASRTLYAFARDRGVPGSDLVGQVHARSQTPVVSIGAIAAGAFALVGAVALAPGAVFDAVAKIATMALYVSYALPIAAGIIARRRGRWRVRGPFHLSAAGVPVAAAALGWCLVVLVVCALPPNVTPAIALAVLLAAIGCLYVAFARQRFRGPKVRLADLERRHRRDRAAASESGAR